MTSQHTNASLEEISAKFKELDSFVICGHVSPDGDCIGSQLALYHGLKKLGKEVVCVVVDDYKIDKNLFFLPGADKIVRAGEYTGSADAFVACDVPSRARIGNAVDIQDRCNHTFTLDHHEPESVMSEYNYIDPSLPSVTMLIWQLLKVMEVQITIEMALCAYTGIVTDTGGFQFQNTDYLAFQLASEMVQVGVKPAEVARQIYQSRSLSSFKLEAKLLNSLVLGHDNVYAIGCISLKDLEECGADKGDTDMLVNLLRSIEGVEVACILLETKDSVRARLRARHDFDVAEIAKKYGGGGHRAAAGCSLYVPLDEALQEMTAYFNEVVVSSEVREKQLTDNSVLD